jgi:hypothetical protein
MNDKIGPSEIVITRMVCRHCRYHISEDWKNKGRVTKYYFCSHPSHNVESSMVFNFLKGRLIGTSEDTPDWCPVKKEREG